MAKKDVEVADLDRRITGVTGACRLLRDQAKDTNKEVELLKESRAEDAAVLNEHADAINDHADRYEALAGRVGSLENWRVAHCEQPPHRQQIKVGGGCDVFFDGEYVAITVEPEPPTTVVYIRWTDAAMFTNGEFQPEEVATLCDMEAAGLLVAETDELVSLAIDRDTESESVRQVLVIPKKNIKQLRRATIKG